MSMPQYFNVVVICAISGYGGEISAATTTLLRAPERGIQPHIVAAAIHGSIRPALSEALATRGLVLFRPVPPDFLDPRSIDLWLALDDLGEKIARRMIDKSGPAPSGFYRHPFPDPVVRFGAPIENPPGGARLESWLDKLSDETKPWRERIWKAFQDSS
jgi:hypothetical protein